MIQIGKIPFIRIDSAQRGLFLSLVNQGGWQEVNFVKTQVPQIRGGHFHTRTNTDFLNTL